MQPWDKDSTVGPLMCSQGGIPFNKAHLDAKDAEIARWRAQCEARAEWGINLAKAEAEIERLRAEVSAWRECALYDPKMEGPAFRGWDRSALDRCRKRFNEQSTREEH